MGRGQRCDFSRRLLYTVGVSIPELTYALPDAEKPAPAPEDVQARLLAWFAAHGRDLPWRRTRDPYEILVAEMMLQQTGVERVLPKWQAWLDTFPTLEALAAAPRGEVIRLWSGLGYNSRAVRLQEIARQAVERYGGRLPDTAEALRELKGIGPYTAGAVLCFAYERDVAFIDTNVRRVLTRVFVGAEGTYTPLTESAASELAERVLPRGQSWAWHQALMDLGATVCVDGKPACLVCPLQEPCRAAFQAGRVAREGRAAYKAPRKEGPWQSSTRYYRGRIVEALRALAPGERIPLAELVARVKPDATDDESALLRDLAARLAADGLAALHETTGTDLYVALPE